MDPATLQMLMQMMQGGKSGLAGILGGLTGNSGAPYEAAEKELGDFYNRGRDIQNPFYNAGKNALGPFQDWLNGMKNPSDFINNLMGKYQESPWAKFQQQQSIRSAGNMGSATGLTGSTPLAQFEQQNARDISSQDMNQWLQNVLGINTQYGAGEQNLISGGQNSANALTNMNSDFGKLIAEMQYGKKAGENADRSNIWGGVFNLFGGGG